MFDSCKQFSSLVLRLATMVWLCPVATVTGAPPSLSESTQGFLQQYCFSCHSGDIPKGERNFERLAQSISDDDALVDYQDIIDQLNLGEMPPADAQQPTAEESRRTIEHLSELVRHYHEQRPSVSRGTVLRRLNAREYRRTIGDLLHLDMSMFDPTVTFPADQTVHHFDNVGEALVTSGYLLNEYLNAADLVIRKVFADTKPPKMQSWSFTDNFRQQPEIDQVHGRVNGFKHLTLYDVMHADKPEGAYAAIQDFASGVPHDGTYQIRFQAIAVNRVHPYGDKYLGRDSSEPLRLGIVAGSQEAGKLYVTQPLEPRLAELDLSDELDWYSVDVHLDRGWTPRFVFLNGLMDVRSLWTAIPRRFPELYPEKVAPGIVDARFQTIKHGKLPHIRIESVEIQGPIDHPWPTPAQKIILGDEAAAILTSGEISRPQLSECLQRFASRAYRRPATEQEVALLNRVVDSQLAAGSTSLEALQAGLITALCSPNFIYLEATSTQKNERLSPTALATRLSYFLWASMPDEELLSLAVDHQLTDPAILARQVSRMLNDPRADGFIEGFLDSWLTLRDLGSQPPDRTRFRDYYQYDLGSAMRTETELFTLHLLRNNLSIMNFINADFTFVNKPLARHYELVDLPDDWEFHQVKLPAGVRGGVLGQGSVQTVTANGIDTSPVVRGVWILENILGTPPSPPPPDVEPLDPDVRGAVTIREQLEKHRSAPNCFDCHRKMDPLGFALENFSPIGGWRTRYEKGGSIDPSGELPTGEPIRNLQDLQQALVAQQVPFTRMLTTKLLTYSTGRQLDIRDRPVVDAIVAESMANGHGFRELVTLVVQSELFQTP